AWSLSRIADELLDLGIITAPVYDYILERDNDSYIFAALEIAGVDAIIYSNETEGQHQEDSLLIWRAEQVKSVFADSFSLGDPALCPQAPSLRADTESWLSLNCQIEDAKSDL